MNKKDFICPYCNKITTTYNYLMAVSSFNAEWKSRSSCINHDINVGFWHNNSNEIDEINLYNVKYAVNIFLSKNNMVIYYNHHLSNISIPIDNNLTPKNFEEKIKTYLIFQ